MGMFGSLKYPYIEILKLRMVAMVLVTTFIGYFLGTRSLSAELVPAALFFTLLGCAAAAAGALVLNQYLERQVDAIMIRTRQRPLPTGKISPLASVLYGTILVMGGVFLLLWQVNLLAAFLVLLIAFLYVVVYTPLKQVTWLNTPIGAIPGAIPPMVGWAAATGQVGLGAWILFLILFVWQHPHFYAIAWLHRQDYQRGGFKMLSVVNPVGLANQVLLYSFLLIPTSLLLARTGFTGQVYFIGALILGTIMLGFGVAMAGTRTARNAKRLLYASLVYLPTLLVLIMVDSRI